VLEQASERRRYGHLSFYGKTKEVAKITKHAAYVAGRASKHLVRTRPPAARRRRDSTRGVPGRGG